MKIFIIEELCVSWEVYISPVDKVKLLDQRKDFPRLGLDNDHKVNGKAWQLIGPGSLWLPHTLPLFFHFVHFLYCLSIYFPIQ